MRNCHSIITDSVGLQIEAYFEHKHSIILRSELEYHSMENMGWSKRIDPQREDLNQCINAAIKSASNSSLHYDEHLFGNGNAARAVVSKILDQ